MLVTNVPMNSQPKIAQSVEHPSRGTCLPHTAQTTSGLTIVRWRSGPNCAHSCREPSHIDSSVAPVSSTSPAPGAFAAPSEMAVCEPPEQMDNAVGTATPRRQSSGQFPSQGGVDREGWSDHHDRGRRAACPDRVRVVRRFHGRTGHVRTRSARMATSRPERFAWRQPLLRSRRTTSTWRANRVTLTGSSNAALSGRFG